MYLFPIFVNLIERTKEKLMNIIADELKLRHDAGAILVIEKIKSLDLDNEALIYYNFPFIGEKL